MMAETAVDLLGEKFVRDDAFESFSALDTDLKQVGNDYVLSVELEAYGPVDLEQAIQATQALYEVLGLPYQVVRRTITSAQ